MTHDPSKTLDGEAPASEPPPTIRKPQPRPAPDELLDADLPTTKEAARGSE